MHHDQHQHQTGPLDGVRVIELASVVMGPLTTRVLGDLGADVIKVEPPEGDFPRHFAPARSAGMSGFFLNLNRNKRSVILDLKDPQARNAVYDLIASADVFVTNLRHRALTALEITDVHLRARRSDLVYCAGRGFGRNGPYADRPAYDDVIQASSGLASLFDHVHGEPA